MTDEAAAMLRISLFGLLAALVYWLVTYESLGSFALLTLGLGPGVAGLIMLTFARKAPGPHESGRDLLLRFAGLPREAPIGDEDLAAEDLAIIPAPSIWPFVISIGLAICLTGLIFGTWLVVIGGVFVAWGAWGWVAAVNRETLLSARQAAAPPPRHRS